MRVSKRKDKNWFREGRWITAETRDGTVYNLTFPVSILFGLL